MKKLIQWIKKCLGITDLEQQIKILKKESVSYRNEVENLRKKLKSVIEDNDLILGHIKFLNSQFFVSADINTGKSYRDPTVILIMKRGHKEILKTYVFDNRTVEEIHRLLEGFGQNNVKYDQPMGYRPPNFRY